MAAIDDKVDDCAICLLVLFEPVRTTCGHHYCHECWKKLTELAITEGHEPSCPTCRATATAAFRDHARDAEVRERHPVEWQRRSLLADSDARMRARVVNAEEAAAIAAVEEAAEAQEEVLPDGSGRKTRRMGPHFLKRHAAEQCSYRTVTLVAKLELTLCGLRDISPALNDYNMLTALRLEHNHLSTLDPIRLPLLRVLSVHHNRIEVLGASLRGVPQLLLLDVGANRLSSLEGVEILANLATLNAPNNLLAGASALAPLDGCAGLATLSSVELHCNQLATVADLEPLTRLHALRQLHLYDNPIAHSLGRNALLLKLPQVRLLDGTPNAEQQRTERKAQLQERAESQRRSYTHLMERKRAAEERRAKEAAAALNATSGCSPVGSPLSEPASSPLDGGGGGSSSRDPPWKVEQIEVTLSPPHPPAEAKVVVKDEVEKKVVEEEAPAKASPDVVEVSEERRRQRERQWEGLAKEGLLNAAPAMAEPADEASAPASGSGLETASIP